MTARKVLLFDGVCNVCDATVNFVHKRDTHKQIFFAPLQSKTGMQYLNKYNASLDVDRVYFIDESATATSDKKNDEVESAGGGSGGGLGTISDRSTAVLQVMWYLAFPWWLLYYLIFVPAIIRDACYRAFASMRFAMFGRKDDDACGYVPGLRRQFLDFYPPQ